MLKSRIDFRSTVFVLLLSLFTCAYASAQETENQESVKSKPEYQIPLVEVLDSYVDIQKALADRSYKKLHEQVKKLTDLSKKYSDQFKEEKELTLLLSEMSKESEKLSASMDCFEHSRESFAKISEIGVSIAKNYLTDKEKKKFTVFHCSRENRKWLQYGSHSPSNPYHLKPYRNRRMGRGLGCDHRESKFCIKEEHKH